MDLNCTLSLPLQENPDVAGVGVLVGFFATAYITLILCIIKYILDHDKTQHPVDRLVLDGLQKLIGRSVLSQPFQAISSEFWNDVLKHTVLSFSDQQVVTSIALLIGGISQFQYGLSSYHWQNIVNLAWFSSVTHLTTLTTLRHDFHRNHAQRSWRVVAMSITAIMLLFGVCSVGYYNGIELGSAAFGLPAWCLFHVDKWRQGILTYNKLYVTISSLILGISYFSRIILVFPVLSTGVKTRIYTRPALNLKVCFKVWETSVATTTPGLGWIMWFIYNICYAIFIITIVTVDLSTSMLWEIVWLIFVLCWSTIRIFVARLEVGQVYPDVINNENTWGFGQVVAVMLLALPFVGFYEAIYDRADTTKSPTSTNLGLFPPNQAPPTNPTGNSNSNASALDSDTFDSGLYLESWLPKIISLEFGLALVVQATHFISYAIQTILFGLQEPQQAHITKTLETLL